MFLMQNINIIRFIILILQIHTCGVSVCEYYELNEVTDLDLIEDLIA